MQAPGGASPIESVPIKYNFLIVLPIIRKPQAYTISVRLVSRSALQTKMRNDFPFASRTPLIHLMSSKTVYVEIEYVDYAVARSFMSTIDDWFKTIPQSSANFTMRVIQRHSHWITRLLKLATALFATFITSNILPHFLNEKEFDLLLFSRLLLWCGAGIYTAYKLAGWFATYAEYAIDDWSETSYVKVNKADERSLTENETKNRSNILKAVSGVCGAIFVGVSVKVVSAVIVAYL